MQQPAARLNVTLGVVNGKKKSVPSKIPTHYSLTLSFSKRSGDRLRLDFGSHRDLVALQFFTVGYGRLYTTDSEAIRLTLTTK